MPTVILTERAIKELHHIIEDQGFEKDKIYVRTGVVGGGCSGYKFSFCLDEEYNENKDEVIEVDGIKVLVDNRSALYMAGTTIDFVETLEKRGFSFNNPQSKSTCGCGSSFST